MPQAINSQNFTVTHRPRLADITEHPQMDFADYERRLALLQGALQRIQQAYLGTSERALLVLEGWDTAGKGGLVRRLGWALDPRSFKVHPIAAPDEHERAQHYLQRFWAPLAGEGANRCVRPVLVWPRSGGARRRLRDQQGMAARLSRDQRVRAHASRLGNPPRQAVPTHHAQRAGTPLPRPAHRSSEALETVL